MTFKFEKVVSYDIETTGFSPRFHEIIEIGATAYYPKTGEVRRFSTLVQPKGKISAKITSITGISESTLQAEGSMSHTEAVQAFRDFCMHGGGRTLYVGHSLKNMDNPFMNKAYRSLRIPRIKDEQSFCTMEHFRKHISGKKPKNGKKQLWNLTAACEYFGIKVKKPAHRALPDSENALQLWAKLKRVVLPVKSATITEPAN